MFWEEVAEARMKYGLGPALRHVLRRGQAQHRHLRLRV